MADNYLITGYWGEPHVTAENDRGINAAMFGRGRFVLPVGEQFRAEHIGNNTIRMYDGKLMDNGAAAGIPAGEYVDLLIPNAGQGMKRNDLIIFQYSQDASTLIESGTFTVFQGVETDGTPEDPMPTQEDLLSGEANFDQFPLWRVSVSGATISAPVKLFHEHKFNSAQIPIKIERIWANGSPYASFEKQNFSLPYGDYDVYMITFGYNTSLGFETTSTAKFLGRNGTNGFGHFKPGDYGEANIGAEVWRPYSIWRSASAGTHGIQFGPGYNNGAADNNVCIPWTIWGIKL